MKNGYRFLSILILLSWFVWSIPFATAQEIKFETPVPSGGSYYLHSSQVDKLSPSSLPTHSHFFTQPGFESLPLSNGFETINFDEDGATTGYYHIPPDPSGACGTNHVVNAVNTSIEWYTKSGTLLSRKSLKNFFTSLSPQTNTFDPKVIYDQYEDRFVVITLEKVSSPARSRIFVAVSATSDPTGSWYYLDIDALETINGDESWADYPGLAVDEEAIYITVNMFSFSGNYKGMRLWIIDKGTSGGFYAGGSAIYNRYDPYAATGMSSYAVTTQPAHVFDAPSGDFGTYLVAYSGYHGGTTEYLLVFLVNNPISSPSFTAQWISCGDFDDNSVAIPEAPQNGTSTTIATNDRRTLNAVWRNNYLYTVATCVPPSGDDAGEATAHWFQINTTDPSSLTLYDHGNVGGEDIAPDCYTFFPSIAVDQHGNIGIGFSASAASIYPGAYYTGRRPSDTPGTVQPSEVMHAGEDYYIRTFGGSRNRWGDYTSISLDPTDDETFWVYNEYAMTRGSSTSGEDGRWATAFGSFSFTAYANLKVFLEGPYNTGGMNTDLNSAGYLPLSQPYNTDPWYYPGTETVTSMPVDIVDWVLVELRTGTDSSSKVATRAALLRNDGQILDLDGYYLRFDNLLPGDYYVVIRHRNHLDVMSANPVTIWSNPTLYDFSTSSSQYYGGSNGAKELETGVWGMVAGDADANGQVQTADKNDYWWIQTGTAGYKSGDFNMNGQVQTSDKNDYWWPNSGIGSQVP